MAEPVTTTDTLSEDPLEQLADKLRSTVPNQTSPELYDDVSRAVGIYLGRNDVQGVSVDRQRELEELLGAQHADLIRAAQRAYNDQKAQLSEGCPQANKHVGADPVMMFNGQFTHTVEDLRVRGAGMDFVFTRTYKNQAFYDGPLGYNWDHSYNLWLREEGMTLVRSSGQLREDRYVLHEHHGYYVPPEGHHDVIEPQGESFVLRSPGGQRLLYERIGQTPTHRARRAEDRDGNYLAFGYDADGRLSRVEVNSPARRVDFRYDVLSRIEAAVAYPVTYPEDGEERKISRVWRYYYDDFGDLVAVTSPGTDRHPEGATTRYEYSSASHIGELAHNLVSITDPEGQLYLENEYGIQKGLLSYDRVVRQRQGNGEFLFEYGDVIPELDWDYGPEEMPTHRTVLYERNGHAVEHLYNARGNLLVKSETVLDDPEACGTRELVWRYRYDRDGTLVSSLSPEGSVTQHYRGREDFYRRSPGAADESAPWRDARLTVAERLAFGNLLGAVKRGKNYSLRQLNLSRGLYGDIFPDVLLPESKDVIVKYSYEPHHQRVASVSDPRRTQSADPRHPEANDPNGLYNRHLTIYEYAPAPPRNLRRVRYPDTTFPSPPSGPPGLKDAVEEYLEYDPKGRLLKMRDPEGGLTAFEYFADGAREGYLRKEVRGAGTLDLATVYEVNEAGVVTATTNPRGVKTHFLVNQMDRTVETVSGGPGLRTKVFFDRNGLVERRERDNLDAGGHPSPDGPETATFCYDAQDNLLRETIGGSDLTLHLVTRHSYDASDKRVRTVLPRGNTVHYGHDERLLPRSVTRGACTPFASTTKTFHDGDGQIVFAVDGRGYVTRYAHDALGNLILTTDALGNLAQREHDKLGNVTVERFFEKRADGAYRMLSRRSYEYDERGTKVREVAHLFEEPIPIADPKGAPDEEFMDAQKSGAVTPVETRYFHDKKRRLFKVIDARGHETVYGYDAADRRVLERDALGNQTRTFYDRNSNVVRVDRHEGVGPGGEEVFSVVNEYDDLDRKVATMDGLGNRTEYAYDSRNNVVSVTDPLGNVRRYQYDVYGRRSKESLETTATGLGGGQRLADVVTLYSYDENGGLAAITDARGAETRYERDPLDRLSRTVYPDDSDVRLRHDADDRVVVTTDNNGLKVLNDFDPLGRKTRTRLDKAELRSGLTYPDGAEEFEEYRYDGLGRVTLHKNDFCEAAARYDSLGRAKEERARFTTPLAPPSGELVLKRTFDVLSNRTGLAYPSGREVRYEYDALNRLEAIRNLVKGQGYPGSKSLKDQHEIARYRYKGLRLGRVEYGNKAGYDLFYDGAGRIISTQHDSGHGPALEIQQLYDGAGNRRFRLDDPKQGPSKAEIYSYDSLYRLTRHERVSRKPIIPGKFAPSSTPLPPEKMLGQQAIDDAIGPMAQDPANYTYRYDALGNREEERRSGQPAVSYAANPLNQYETVGAEHLRYDPNGNLVDDGEKEYLYDHRNLLVRVREKTTGADLLRLFYDALGRLICAAEGVGTAHLVNDGPNVIEEYSGGAVAGQYVNEDGLDRACQAAGGGKEWWYHRDTLGSTRLLTGADGKVLPEANYDYYPFGEVLGTVKHRNPYLFCGKRLLRSIGLYHSRARQYSPALGRFLQRDPKGTIDGPNLYVYAANNPVTFIDPWGTEKTTVTLPEEVSFPEDVIVGSGLLQSRLATANEASRNATSREERDYYEAQIRLLMREAIGQGQLSMAKFGLASYAVATATALGGWAFGEVGAGIAAYKGLGTVGTNVLTYGLAGAGSAAAREETLMAFGKQTTTQEFLTEVGTGAAFGVAFGALASGYHYYTYPVGAEGPGKFGWKFVIRESSGPISRPIGPRQDPDRFLDPHPEYHRAHFRAHMLGGPDDELFYASRRVNLSWMKIFENAAARPAFSGGNMQVMTLRGGGRTTLDWSAYTASGQRMQLMLPHVTENLPTLAPILRSNNMTVGPGTTLMVED